MCGLHFVAVARRALPVAAPCGQRRARPGPGGGIHGGAHVVVRSGAPRGQGPRCSSAAEGAVSGVHGKQQQVQVYVASACLGCS
jgi:hypothetical protein